jgi:hypothetical protein
LLFSFFFLGCASLGCMKSCCCCYTGFSRSTSATRGEHIHLDRKSISGETGGVCVVIFFFFCRFSCQAHLIVLFCLSAFSLLRVRESTCGFFFTLTFAHPLLLSPLFFCGCRWQLFAVFFFCFSFLASLALLVCASFLCAAKLACRWPQLTPPPKKQHRAKYGTERTFFYFKKQHCFFCFFFLSLAASAIHTHGSRYGFRISTPSEKCAVSVSTSHTLTKEKHGNATNNCCTKTDAVPMVRTIQVISKENNLLLSPHFFFTPYQAGMHELSKKKKKKRTLRDH